MAKEHKLDFFLSAAECNAQQEMSLPLLVQRVIDIATAHANSLGVGYERLIQDNNAWVLSRLSINMDRFPTINTNYSLRTWVQDVNRHFSERIIEIDDAEGLPIGFARTTWVAINIDTRRPADLTPLLPNITPSDRPCPLARHPKLTAIADPNLVTSYRFKYSDIDFNRHVNSARYLEYMLNFNDVEFYDTHRISACYIAYMGEVHFHEDVTVKALVEPATFDIQLESGGSIKTRARIEFADR